MIAEGVRRLDAAVRADGGATDHSSTFIQGSGFMTRQALPARQTERRGRLRFAAPRPGRRSLAARLLALELLEERRPLTAQSDGFPSSPTALDDLVVRSSLHERDWIAAPALAEAGQPEAVPPFPLGDTFKLHSRPGATKVVYLDFDGHVTTGTFWNQLWNLPTIDTPAYSTEGDRSFSNNELERIQIIWERVVEDFLPFDVDVTTEDPGVEALRRFGAGDQQWGIRVVIGEDQANTGAGGIAFIGSFIWNTDTPTFVFNESLVGIAEAASHEVGHTLGLRHDGQTGGVEYYVGHGNGATGWAPIMGVGYDRQLVQWTRGQYPRANNFEDDLAIITTQNGFDYRPDDHSNTSAGATSLANSGTALSGEGVIERNSDFDYFAFTTGAGSVTINVAPFYRSPNLDILITLYDAEGSVVAASNPANDLNATLNLTLARGTYYLAVDGTGRAANGSDAGYSDYGSLGYFSITGARVDPDLAGVHGVTWSDRNGDGIRSTDEPGLEGWIMFIDANSNGQLDAEEQSTITDANGAYSLENLNPGVYVVAEAPKPGWKSTLPTAPGTYSVTLGMGEQAFGLDFGNQAGSIRGQKWFDRNADGVKDDDERGLAGWTIYLDADDNGALDDGEVSATTDAAGDYAFFDLVAGSYTVAEVLRAEWLQTYPASPGTHSIDLSLAQQEVGIDFGNTVGSISGLVWNDRDGDGVQDAGELGQEGWTVYLDDNDNGAFDNGPTTIASTDAPQTIVDFTTILAELTVSGLTSINDLNVRLNIEHSYVSDLDVFLISPAGSRIELFTDVGLNGDNLSNTLLDDEAATAITAGSAPYAGSYRPEGQLAELDGENPNGVWTLEITDDGNADQGMLLGWSLAITTSERFIVTDVGGRYEFLELSAGDYAVGRITPPTWVPTVPAASASRTLSLTTGQSLADVNFGHRRATIAGQAWNDRDGDGVKDPNESGLADWVVYLDHNGNGALDAGAQTAAAGNLPQAVPDLGALHSTLLVSGLTEIEDVNVTLSIDHPYLADLDVTLVSPSGTRVELFSDVGGSGQNLVNTTLDDEALISIDVSPGVFTGSFKPEGRLADLQGENPNGAWTLEVIDDAGNDVGALKSWSLTITAHERSVETDANGNFAFFDLPPGAYTVRDVAPLNWTATYPGPPGVYVMSLTAGQQSTNNNFGARAAKLFGDYSQNDVVDGFDFLLWQRQLGSTVVAGGGADGNGNGSVDGGDLGVWRNNFGSSQAAGVALAATPAASSGDAFGAAFADLDAAGLIGPFERFRDASSTSAARPSHRPVPRLADFRAASAPATLAVVMIENDDGNAPQFPAGDDAGEAGDASLEQALDEALAHL